jgi:hypothetical protein
LEELHAGGIEFVVSISRDLLADALTRLTYCHDHVFVVDQSKGNLVQLGLSESGLKCFHQEFGGSS